MKTKTSAYIEMTKPRILMLVLVTTALGFFLGGKGSLPLFLIFWTLLGAALVCAGASVLNHYLERDLDCKMLRTQNRPIPQGVIPASNALGYGILLVLVGVCVLCLKVNLLTAFLSLLTAFLYVLIYTPLKTRTWLNTTIGAIPGAIPPMGGWAASTGNLDFGAWILFAILFVWQHPHFYAIAWMFREDYKRAGFKMLPVVDPGGRSTFQQVMLYSLVLIPVSLLPTITGMSGGLYFWGAMVAGFGLLLGAIIFVSSKSFLSAKNLLKATVFYLPALLILIVIDAVL